MIFERAVTISAGNNIHLVNISYHYILYHLQSILYAPLSNLEIC